MPLWVDLKGVPNTLYSHKGLKCLVGAVGHFVKLHPNTEKLHPNTQKCMTARNRVGDSDKMRFKLDGLMYNAPYGSCLPVYCLPKLIITPLTFEVSEYTHGFMECVVCIIPLLILLKLLKEDDVFLDLDHLQCKLERHIPISRDIKMESADLSSFSKPRDKLIWDLTGESVAVKMEDG
ncbi:hypothetical protein YC2023_041993 [Brassica napus]